MGLVDLFMAYKSHEIVSRRLHGMQVVYGTACFPAKRQVALLRTGSKLKDWISISKGTDGVHTTWFTASLEI
jgi:hypothetical protein